jgi:hypothetical protein
MKAINYISRKEHYLLSIVAFSAFVFVALPFVFEIVKFSNYNSAGFSSSNTTFSLVPPFHFLTLFIFLSILKTKRFLLPVLLTVLYAVIFIFGLVIRISDNEFFSPEEVLLSKIYYAARGFDYLAALFISILLFWQISILLRMLIKTKQRKPILP